MKVVRGGSTGGGGGPGGGTFKLHKEGKNVTCVCANLTRFSS